MGCMGITEKAKEIADVALEKAGLYSEKASAKASELAERAGEKATELSGVAREKAPGYLDRATELAGKAVDATAAGVDKATKGRFHEQIDTAHGKVDETLDRARAATNKGDEPSAPPITGGLGTPAPDADTAQGPLITPAATNPDEDAKG
jgi:hypothetical protein